jgi:hypothetical protein
MSGFGPFYPPLLQDAVNHAERLANMLRRVPVPGADDEASAWVTGRAEEIECFVSAVTRDWRAARLSDASAAATIGCYVDTLHRDLGTRVGLHAPRCCTSPYDVTAEPLSCLSVTVPPTVSPLGYVLESNPPPGATTLLLALDLPWGGRRR